MFPFFGGWCYGTFPLMIVWSKVCKKYGAASRIHPAALSSYFQTEFTPIFHLPAFPVEIPSVRTRDFSSKKPQAFYDKISQRRSVWRYNRVLRQGLAGAWLVGVPTKVNRGKDERSWVSQKDRLCRGGRLFVFIGSRVVSNWPCTVTQKICFLKGLTISELHLPFCCKG